LGKQKFQVGRMNPGEVGRIDVSRLAQDGGANLRRANAIYEASAVVVSTIRGSFTKRLSATESGDAAPGRSPVV
jgi:hypothetical protein